MKINFILVAFLILSASAVAQQIADSRSTEASLASALPDAPSFLSTHQWIVPHWGDCLLEELKPVPVEQ